jgi:hypothetical protein
MASSVMSPDAAEVQNPRTLKQITIGELYVFLLKLTAASFLVALPIALIWWLVTYVATH